MFLVLHTSGLTLIPLSIITYRIASGSHNPASIFIPCVLGTLCATMAAIIVVGFWQKIKWDIVLIGWLAALLAIMGAVLFWVNGLNPDQKQIFSKVSGNLILLLIV